MTENEIQETIRAFGDVQKGRLKQVLMALNFMVRTDSSTEFLLPSI